jgi:hypothetical protein
MVFFIYHLRRYRCNTPRSNPNPRCKTIALIRSSRACSPDSENSKSINFQHTHNSEPFPSLQVFINKLRIYNTLSPPLLPDPTNLCSIYLSPSSLRTINPPTPPPKKLKFLPLSIVTTMITSMPPPKTLILPHRVMTQHHPSRSRRRIRNCISSSFSSFWWRVGDCPS